MPGTPGDKLPDPTPDEVLKGHAEGMHMALEAVTSREANTAGLLHPLVKEKLEVHMVHINEDVRCAKQAEELRQRASNSRGHSR